MKDLARFSFCVLSLLLSSTITSAADEKELATPQHGEFPNQAVQVNGQSRVYRLVVPKTVDLSQPAPLVVALHGIRIDDKDVMPRYSKLNETAEKHRFILVYPNAIDKSWGLRPEKTKQDLALFDALTEKMCRRYKIDEQRIYVMGMSNGAYFAHLIGQQRSTKVAAVVAHSGSLGLQARRGISAERKFPVMIVHGDQDKLLPVRLGRESRDRYKSEGHGVEYIEVPGLGHQWATEANINEKIWKFLSSHSLRK